MVALIWHQLLRTASNTDEVHSVVRDFVDAMDPLILARLPQHFHPRRALNGHDLRSYVGELTHYQHREADPQVADAVQRLTTFLSGAAERLAQLA